MKENTTFQSSKNPSEKLFANSIITNASSSCAAQQSATSGAAQCTFGAL